jgi:Smg protein
MKENVLDVLVYLFEHFMYDEPETPRDRDSLQANLVQAGFSPAEISKAFDWLDELERRRPESGTPAAGHGPVRLYSEPEMARLDSECRGFLMYLEAERVLDSARRELVLDRVMALELEEFDLEDLKWVVLMVLFNQPGQEAAFAWMESHLFADSGESVH